MRDFPSLSSNRREDKKVSLDGPNPNAPKKNRFKMLQSNKDKGANSYEGNGKEYLFVVVNVLLRFVCCFNDGLSLFLF